MIVGVVGLTLLGGTAAAATEQPACGVPVTHDVTLIGDLPCGLTIGASGLTLDLGGFEVNGDIVFPSFQSEPDPLTDVIIRNGRLSAGSGLKVHSRNPNSFSHTTLITIEDVKLRGESIVWGGTSLTLRSVLVDSQGGTGFYLFHSTLASVEGSTFANNDTGIELHDSRLFEAADNRFLDNGVGLYWWEQEAGSRLNPGARVVGNLFRGNERGLWFRPIATGTGARFEQNRFDRNRGDGLRLEVDRPDTPTFAAFGTQIVGNMAQRNGGSGIVVITPQPSHSREITVTGNRSFHNHAYGIDAPDVTDGGDNHARHNGQAGQCVGVRCLRGAVGQMAQ